MKKFLPAILCLSVILLLLSSCGKPVQEAPDPKLTADELLPYEVGSNHSNETKYLQGDELEEYFLQVYNLAKSLEIEDSYRIDAELAFLTEYNDTGKELPNDYKERYIDWRPEETIETPPKPTDNTIQSTENNVPPEQDEVTPDVPVRDLFTDVRETVYAVSNVNIRAEANAYSKKVGQLKTAESILRVGIGTGEATGWSEVVLTDGKIAYINSSYLSTTKPVAQQPTTTPSTPPTNNSNNSGGITGGNSSVDANGDGFPDSWQIENPDDGSGSSSIIDDNDGPISTDTDHDYSGIVIH